jgi:hypothetical protein
MFTAVLNLAAMVLFVLFGIVLYQHANPNGLTPLNAQFLAGVLWTTVVLLAVNLWSLRKLYLKNYDLKERLNVYYGAFSTDPNKRV